MIIRKHAFVSFNVPPTNMHSTICRILEAAMSIKETIVVMMMMMMLRARIAKENFSKIVEL